MSRLSLTSLAFLLTLSQACRGAESPHFNPDADPSRIEWTEVAKVLGPPPQVQGQRFGVIIKTPTNEYWRLMTAGYRRRAAADGVKLDIQAAQSETDSTRQLAAMEVMIGSGYRALMISPISASNLKPAIDDAVMANVPVVDVDGAVVDSVRHFVGAVNRDMGASVARWFIRNHPEGGRVAIVQGQEGVFSTVQRTAGFVDTLLAAANFQVAASPFGNWDRRQSYDAALAIVRQAPDLLGIYCNNDTMALGVVDAVKSLNLLGRIRVFGTDGTRDAYASIKAGELTGTVDIFPTLTGELGLDIAERLSVGQRVPRVIATPQALVTRDTMARYQGSEDGVLKALYEDAARKP